MLEKNREIKDAILMAALPDVPFEGWTDALLARAAETAGFSKDMARAVFPSGTADALRHLSGFADRLMLEGIDAASFDALRVREKITVLVQARLDALAPYKEAERQAVAYWSGPLRKADGAKLVWKTADVIWTRAGDTATDYNHYTKRMLLSAVLVSTMLCWLTDTSADHKTTRAFLDRRIDNVLSFGKIVGRFKKS